MGIDAWIEGENPDVFEVLDRLEAWLNDEAA